MHARPPRRLAWPSIALAAAALGVAPAFLMAAPAEPGPRGPCPPGAVAIEGRYCIDRYEAGLVEVLPSGETRAWSPYAPPVEGRTYRAVARAGEVPQGYMSQVQAQAACANAGKRLCRADEWVHACRGPEGTTWPYGERYAQGTCNDGRAHPIVRLFPGVARPFTFARMNDPRVNQQPRTVARSGEFAGCTNAFGVHDMVGNLHEWTGERRGARGVFRGGFYVDVRLHGDGCRYRTTGHGPEYHDYSIGFRCCADVAPGTSGPRAGGGT